MAIFLHDGQTKINEIKACLETNNLSLFTIYVHALKSASANIGADMLPEMALSLETAGNQGNEAFIKENNVKFLAALETLLTNIKTALAEQKQAVNQDAVDVTLLKTELTKLAEAIDRLNLRAIKEAVKSVQSFSHAVNTDSIVEDILQNASVGEYDEAALKIRKFLQDS